MLHRAHPGPDRGARRVVSVAVRGRRAVPAAGLVHQGVHLLLRHGDAQIDDLPGRQELPVIAVKLDPVGPVLDLLAHRLADLPGPVGDLHPLRDGDLGGVPEKRVVSGGRDGARRHLHPGTGDDPVADGVPQLRVPEQRALRLEIADRREAGEQEGARRVRRLQRAAWQRLLQELHVVVPGLQEGVRVRVHEPRQDGVARQVVERRPLRRLRPGVEYSVDPVALDDHQGALLEGAGPDVEQPPAAQGGDLRRRRRPRGFGAEGRAGRQAGGGKAEQKRFHEEPSIQAVRRCVMCSA